MIKLKGVSKYYKTQTGVSEGMRDVTVNFALNEFVAITGESGSGKTTLLNVLSGLDSYEDGELYINDKETSHYTVKEWENFRASNVGFVFQSYNVIDSYSVYQNVLIALEAQGYNESDKKTRALELIERVGLISHKNQKTSKLSGGQKQRVVIARALAKNAPIILADEPTGNLDAKSGTEIMKLLKEISKDKLIVLVTHNYEEAKPYVTRKITMSDATIKDDKVLIQTEKQTVIVKDDYDTGSVDSIKVASKIATRNIIATPKRTIFSLMLSIVAISIFLLFYAVLIKESQIDFNMSIYDQDKGYIQVRQEGTEIDKDIMDDLKNLYETKHLKINLNLPDAFVHENSKGLTYGVRQSNLINEKDLTKGSRLPMKSDEIVVFSRWDNSTENYKIDDTINFRFDFGVINFKIVGFIDGFDNNLSSGWRDDTIFFHQDFLYDQNYILNDKIYDDSKLYEVIVVGSDRQEIEILRDKVNTTNTTYRFIDPYLQNAVGTEFFTSTMLIFFWVLLIAILSVVFLVTYNVQKNIMDSRKKDFAVYRSIGISEKEVGITILIEQLIIALLAVGITFVGLYLLSQPIPFLRNITRHLHFSDFVLVSVIFALFSIYQGLKFNKKIFNITVIESLREDY